MHVGVTFSVGKINFLLHYCSGIIHLFLEGFSRSQEWSVECRCSLYLQVVPMMNLIECFTRVINAIPSHTT